MSDCEALNILHWNHNHRPYKTIHFNKPLGTTVSSAQFFTI